MAPADRASPATRPPSAVRPFRVMRSPLGIALTSHCSRSANWALVMVRASAVSSGLPAIHTVALSAINARAASNLLADMFSSQLRTTVLFASALIVHLLCTPRCTARDWDEPLRSIIHLAFAPP